MAGRSSLKLWVVAGDASRPTPKPAPGTDESVGLFLRLLRERAGVSLDHAAQHVRIRQAYVSAIEDDRFDALPGRAYAMGFVRAYAEFLGADVEATARAVSLEIGRLPEPTLRTRKPEADRESRFAPAAAAMICVALAGYVYWYFDNTRGRFETAVETLARVDAPNFVDAVENGEAPQPQPYRPFPNARAPNATPIPDALAINRPSPEGAVVVGPPATIDPLTAPPAPAQSPVAATETVTADVAAAASTTDLPPPQALAEDLPAPRLSATPQRSRSVPSPGPAMAATPNLARLSPSYAAAAAAPTSINPPMPAPGQVMLHARADTWIEIRARSSGKVLFSRVLRAGETIPAPDRRGLSMTIGNAGGLEIRVDGKAAPALGGPGEVVRDVSLDSEDLLTPAG